MAEEINQVEEPQEIDWQAKYEEMRSHSRDWEKKAKANQSAADELQKLKEQSMSDMEKAEARANEAEKQLAAIKAEQERTESAKRVSNETKVPLELLLFLPDEQSMVEFAKSYEKQTRVQAAPNALNGSQIVAGGENTQSTADVFSEFASQFFK